MTKFFCWCLTVGVCAFTVRSAWTQTGPETGLILPGMSVAGVKLGDDASRFEAVFPNRHGAEDHSLSGAVGEQCPAELYYWSDLSPDTSVVTAYLRNGGISQISAQGPRFSLPNGLKDGMTEEQVQHAYPNGKMYILLHSGSKVNGGQDLYYWVEKRAGLAFKLAYWQSKKQRAISAIDIFPKGSEYRPGGCILTPQNWQKLNHSF